MEFRTQGYNGYAVKYSPFFDNRIAVAASANYGIVGNGRVYVLQLTPNGIQAEKLCANASMQRGSALLTSAIAIVHRTPYMM